MYDIGPARLTQGPGHWKLPPKRQLEAPAGSRRQWGRCMSKAAVFFCLSLVVTASFADAEGNLAAQPIDLPQLMLKGDLSMPQTEYVL